MTAISEVLWLGMKALVPTSQLGGILADKPGYHNMRRRLPSTDYSVTLPIDKLGPDNEGSAIDWTFPNAQAGNYSTIALYSKRLYDAGVTDDPRAYPMREFFGNIDLDSTVEGWSYYRNAAASSDTSHLWHIHISIHRKYINDTAAMNSILDILGGDDMAFTEAQMRGFPWQYVGGGIPAGYSALKVFYETWYNAREAIAKLDLMAKAVNGLVAQDLDGDIAKLTAKFEAERVESEAKFNAMMAAVDQVDEEVADKLLVAPVDELANLLKQLPADRLAELKAKL